MNDKLNVIDLFAGVGGMSYGFSKAGFNIVLANEIDPMIARAYSENHSSSKMIIDDIQNLNIKETFSEYKDKVGVIVGGPPCQGFSQKGQRKTINDERNFLFRYFYDVVSFIRPKYFVMENVPNLLTNENGYFLREIEALFSNINYSIVASVLNAADYGVPQNRRRAIIVGKLGQSNIELPKKKNARITIWDAISDLAFLESGEGILEQDYINKPLSDYQIQMRNGSVRLFNHIATNHTSEAIDKMKLIPPERGKEVLPQDKLTKSIYSGTWSRMIKNQQSVTITTRFDTPSSGRFIHPYLNRAITVREAARLQSFPDTYKFIGTKSSQMKQVGNAVPPKLSFEIATSIKKDIEKEKIKCTHKR